MAQFAFLLNFFIRIKLIGKEDLNTLAKSIMLKEDIEDFVELKRKREDATYSISVTYEKHLVELLGTQAIDFVNKIEFIIEQHPNT